jgi:hypothetical protein
MRSAGSYGGRAELKDVEAAITCPIEGQWPTSGGWSSATVALREALTDERVDALALMGSVARA